MQLRDVEVPGKRRSARSTPPGSVISVKRPAQLKSSAPWLLTPLLSARADATQTYKDKFKAFKAKASGLTRSDIARAIVSWHECARLKTRVGLSVQTRAHPRRLNASAFAREVGVRGRFSAPRHHHFTRRPPYPSPSLAARRHHHHHRHCPQTPRLHLVTQCARAYHEHAVARPRCQRGAAAASAGALGRATPLFVGCTEFDATGCKRFDRPGGTLSGGALVRRRAAASILELHQTRA